jgi:hypothetical protein
MPIDRFHQNPEPGEEISFFIRDPEGTYTHSDICDLLEQAEALGFSLEPGSEIAGLTARELEKLVKTRQ